MMYKLFNEEGNWVDKTTNERVNVLRCNIAWTPEGENVGWTQFDTDEAMATQWGLEPWIEPLDTEDAEYTEIL